MTEIIKQFKFEENQVRVSGTYENPMFVAKDICNIMGLTNVTNAIKPLPVKWTGTALVNVANYPQQLNVITEAGLYKLIMRSNKPIAQTFQEWICEDVLPSIRKTGSYEMKKRLEETNNKYIEQAQEIQYLNRLLKTKEKRNLKIGNCVYMVKNPDNEGKYKLGCTKNINNRLVNYEGTSPHKYEVLHSRYMPIMKHVEGALLFILDKQRCDGVNSNKKREWIEMDSDLIKEEMDGLCDYIIDRRKHHDEKYEDITAMGDVSEESLETDVKEVTKNCTGCEEDKSLDEYYSRKDNADGKEKLCKVCYVARQLKQREKKHKERLEANFRKCKHCLHVKNIGMFKKCSTFKDGYGFVCYDCNMPSEISLTEKKCSGCKILKSLEEYSNYKRSVDGKCGYCKPCSRERLRVSRDKNREEVDKDLTSKTCRTCKIPKDIVEFSRHKQSKDGFCHKCKKCVVATKNKPKNK